MNLVMLEETESTTSRHKIHKNFSSQGQPTAASSGHLLSLE